MGFCLTYFARSPMLHSFIQHTVELLAEREIEQGS
jgi:hypothetical protein